MSKRRRSKRKAAALASLNLVESDDEGLPAHATDDSLSGQDTSEESSMSDEENILHGPCNIDPAGADVNSRFVCVLSHQNIC